MVESREDCDGTGQRLWGATSGRDRTDVGNARERGPGVCDPSAPSEHLKRDGVGAWVPRAPEPGSRLGPTGAGQARGGAGLGAGPGSRGPGRGRAGAAQPRGGRRACGAHRAAAGAAATPGSMKDRTQELRTVSPAPARRRWPPAPRARSASRPTLAAPGAVAPASPARAGASGAEPATPSHSGSRPSDPLGSRARVSSAAMARGLAAGTWGPR